MAVPGASQPCIAILNLWSKLNMKWVVTIPHRLAWETNDELWDFASLFFFKAVRSHSLLLRFLVWFDNQIKLGLHVLGRKQLFKNVTAPTAANLHGKFSVC